MILARMKSNWTCWIFFMTHTFYVNKDRKVCTGPQHLMSDETTLVFALRWKTETGLFRFLFKFRLKTRPWAPCNALRCKKWIICGFFDIFSSQLRKNWSPFILYISMVRGNELHSSENSFLICDLKKKISI